MNTLFSKLYKQAEQLITSEGKIAQLIDELFLKLGESAEQFYMLQDSLVALGRMLSAWVKGDYKNISTTSIIAVVAAIIYFVNPLDIIPDFIPIIGKLDDIVILGYLIKLLNKEIERFMAWEEAQSEIK